MITLLLYRKWESRELAEMCLNGFVSLPAVTSSNIQGWSVFLDATLEGIIVELCDSVGEGGLSVVALRKILENKEHVVGQESLQLCAPLKRLSGALLSRGKDGDLAEAVALLNRSLALRGNPSLLKGSEASAAAHTPAGPAADTLASPAHTLAGSPAVGSPAGAASPASGRAAPVRRPP